MLLKKYRTHVIAVQDTSDPPLPDDGTILIDFKTLPQSEAMTVKDVNKWITGYEDLVNEFNTDAVLYCVTISFAKFNFCRWNMYLES